MADWSILGGILFFSQLAKGGTNSLWLIGVQTFGDILVFVLSIKYGIGGMLKRDIFALLAAFGGLVIWYFTKEGSYALFIAIFIDAVGAMLTIIKSFEQPGTESVFAWSLTSLGGLLAIFAVGKLDFVLLAFPIYIFVMSLVIVFSALYSQRKLI